MALQTDHIHTQKLQAFSRSLSVPAPALPASARELTIPLGLGHIGAPGIRQLINWGTTGISKELLGPPLPSSCSQVFRPLSYASFHWGHKPAWLNTTNRASHFNGRSGNSCVSIIPVVERTGHLRCSPPCAQPVFTNPARTPVSFPFGRARNPSRLWPHKEKYGGS
jgi:hypothetical protein